MTFDEESWVSNWERKRAACLDDNDNDNETTLVSVAPKDSIQHTTMHDKLKTQLKIIQVDNDMWIVNARKELLLLF